MKRLHVLTKTGALRAWASVLAVLIASVGVSLFAIAYTNSAWHAAKKELAAQQRQSDQDWCDFLIRLPRPVSSVPKDLPAAERQRQIDNIYAFRRLLVKKGCLDG